MGKLDKRKYPLIKIYDPISYIGLDENQHIVEQQMGVALDIAPKNIILSGKDISRSIMWKCYHECLSAAFR